MCLLYGDYIICMDASPLLFVLRQLGEISFIVSRVIHEQKTVFRNLLQIAVLEQVFVIFHRSLLPNAETTPPMPSQRMEDRSSAVAVNAERIRDFFVYIRGKNLYKILCGCSCAKYQQTTHLLHQLLWSDRFGFAVSDALRYGVADNKTLTKRGKEIHKLDPDLESA